MSTWPTDAEREDFNTFETFVDVDDCLTTRILTTEEIIQQVAKHVARREREAAAQALWEAEREARERGDIGKDGGPEVWEWLAYRVDRIKQADRIERMT